MWQIQSIPTPIIYESRRRGGFKEIANTTIQLVSVNSVQPFAGSPLVEDSAPTAGLALASLILPGPKTQNQTDNATAGLQMPSLFVPTPLEQDQTDPGTAALSLASLFVVQPLERDQTESVTTGINLVSCIVI